MVDSGEELEEAFERRYARDKKEAQVYTCKFIGGLLIRSRHVVALSAKLTSRHRHFGHGTRLYGRCL